MRLARRFARSLGSATIAAAAALFLLATASTAAEIFKLTASDATSNDRFGISVGASGNTAIVGAHWDNVPDVFFLHSGSAYLFDLTTGQQLHKLVPSDKAANDEFGWAVSISGNTAIIAAPGDNGGAGSAYLFNAGTGQQLFKLIPSDSIQSMLFGFSTAIDGNRAIVGAVGNSSFRAGAAYVFDATTGQQLRKLTAPSGGNPGDNFGSYVALSGNLALVGRSGTSSFDSGSAYLFDINTGQQLHEFIPSDAAPGDRIGWSVSMSDNVAIIGSPFDDDAGNSSGSAYLFDLTTGQQLHKLTALDAEADDAFGTSVSIRGNIALVGSWRDDDHGSMSGSAYFFDVITGQQLAKLAASDAGAGDEFGNRVFLSGDRAFVAAVADDHSSANSAGSVYVLDTVPEPTLFGLVAPAAGVIALRRRKIQ
jgi:outer membrane protein assembly factor BamB